MGLHGFLDGPNHVICLPAYNGDAVNKVSGYENQPFYSPNVPHSLSNTTLYISYFSFIWQCRFPTLSISIILSTACC